MTGTSAFEVTNGKTMGLMDHCIEAGASINEYQAELLQC